APVTGGIDGEAATLGLATPRLTNFSANADLHLTASFTAHAGPAQPGLNGTEQNMSLPSIQTDFHLGWDLSGSDPGAPLANLGGARDVASNNVQIGLATSLGSAMAPIVSIIQRVTEPLQPALDVLNYAIPGLSDLGAGNVSLLTLANLANEAGVVPTEF